MQSSSALVSCSLVLPLSETIQLPARDTRNIEKAAAKEQEDIDQGRAIRREADPDQS